MKVFAVILSLFIFTLSAFTYNDVDELFGKREIVLTHTGDNQQSDDDGCPPNCSPFRLCHACTGFTLPLPLHVNQSIVQSEQQDEIPYAEQLVSSFEGNIWQPPKIG